MKALLFVLLASCSYPMTQADYAAEAAFIAAIAGKSQPVIVAPKTTNCTSTVIAGTVYTSCN